MKKLFLLAVLALVMASCERTGTPNDVQNEKMSTFKKDAAQSGTENNLDPVDPKDLTLPPRR